MFTYHSYLPTTSLSLSSEGLTGPFLSEVTIFERGMTAASECSSDAVPLVEPIKISLSPILDCYRFNRLDCWCFFRANRLYSHVDVLCIRAWLNAQRCTHSTLECLNCMPLAGRLFPLPLGGARAGEIGTAQVPAASCLGSMPG
jgi:hypothetical protein